MLILRRREGQWVEFVHRSGDVLKVRLTNIRCPCANNGMVDVVVEDNTRNFFVQRPERLENQVNGLP